MSISARPCDLKEIAPLRQQYREEMDCQIIHDSIHIRRGWSLEYALDVNGTIVGYGSVAVAGPWSKSSALYEFFIRPESRRQIFDSFEALLMECWPSIVETQTNDPILTIMLHTFGRNVRAEAILFEGRFDTELAPEGAGFRPAAPDDVDLLKSLHLNDTAAWVVTLNGSIAGAGGVLYHYNRPYGDI